MVNKKICKELGFEAAVILSDLISKRQYFIENKDLSIDDYFFNTAENITIDTGLSKYQQSAAIEKLKSFNFLDSKILGVPAKKYFKIFDNNILKYLIPSSQKTEQLEVKILDGNKNKEIIINNKNKVLDLPERLNAFKQSVLTLLENDVRDTGGEIGKFIDYWTETNLNGKKMRFEAQKFFDIKKRWATWKRNNEKFNPVAKPEPKPTYKRL